MISLIQNLFYTLLAVLILAGIFCTFLGILTVFHWVQSPKAPNDKSNRINNIKSWWLGLTRPEILGRAYDDFKKDVLEQVEN